MSFNLYSEVFKNLLLRNVVIKYGEKTYKSGKIQNFDIKQFYIKLFIENHKKQHKLIELPYPFRVEVETGKTTLNYHISSFCDKENILFTKLTSLDQSETGKFYDNVVEILVVD
jgi:hypothetical protein